MTGVVLSVDGGRTILSSDASIARRLRNRAQALAKEHRLELRGWQRAGI